MNITQIKYVLEAARASSMREASTRLYVSQPALSSSIRDLENELGILIFERTNKGILLTEEGREFIMYAKKVVGQYEILEDRYMSVDSDKERFAVSTQHYNFSIHAFAETVRKASADKYVFSIYETKTKIVLEDVKSLKSEVGIVSFSNSNEAVIKKLIREYQLTFVPLMTREAYIYVWKEHELADRSEVSMEDLKEYPCITFDQSDDSNVYLTEEAMADHTFDKMIKSDDRASSIELIATLGGYSIGSGMLSEENALLQGLVSIKLKEKDTIVIGYVVRDESNLSVYGRLYIEELLKYREIM